MPQVIEIKAPYYADSISKIIDNWANNNITTRHHAAQHIISAGAVQKVKAFFNDSNIIAYLPMRYVKEWRKTGASDEGILKHCVVTGLGNISIFKL